MIIDWLEEWFKGVLIDGIIGNLSGLFDTVNTKVGEIAVDVGATPQDWNSGIFNMIRNLSESVIIPIAGAILAFVMTYELIQMVTEKNNLHDIDTFMFFKWVFKTYAAVLIVTNTWNIVMGVFDAAQQVVNQSAGVIIGNTSIDIDSLVGDLQTSLEAMSLGGLIGLWFQSLFVGLTMNILSICIMLVVYGRMIEIYKNGFQRHDSMYVFLLPCMVFLFHFVLHFRGKQVQGLRIASLLIYLVHPMMIVVVRAAAKLTHLQSILVDNSLVHFAAVCLASLLFSFAAAMFWERAAGKQHHRTKTERAYIELNLAHLSHNAAALQAAMPQGCELMAVVKTEAYGHGAYEISTRLEKDGVKAFAVATIDEGIRLRCYGIRGDILILGFTDVHRARELKKYRLTQTLIDAAYAECLNQQGTPVRVHIGIDSGMHRLGFDADDFENIRQVFRMKNLKVDGMFTHLCCCESLEPEDVAFTKNQICRFYALIDYLKEHKVPIPKLHIQSSYGLLNYPELKCDYVREGISLYGVASTPQDKTTLQLDLRPVLALKAKVILIRDVPQGDFVGYDRAYQTERDSKIAILPIGYGDGFPRNLSCGKASVKIDTYIVPIIGRICMDQLAIDITDTEGVAVGDTATLIDNQENSLLSTPCVAERSDSISNEILSRMGARLPVVAIEEC